MTDVTGSEHSISSEENPIHTNDNSMHSKDDSIPSKDSEEEKHTKTEIEDDNDKTPESKTIETYMTPETLEKLTLGFLSSCLPDLQKAKGALSEILTSQTVLQETVQNENVKFQVNEDIEKTMTKAKLYHSKLLYLKREMNSLADKSFKLKKRGIKLQQQKIKEELQKKEQEEKEKMREEMLTAKVAKKRSSSQSDKS